MKYPLQAPLICILGPTASGKTDLAQALAERLPAAVMSADSMQIYKGMDIGTGKIPYEQRSVEYFGLDLVNPNEPYSASLFQSYARSIIEQRDSLHMRTILCGGTGFYVRAVIDDFNFPAGEQLENKVRDFYTKFLNEHGHEALWQKLFELDPASAHVIPPRDSKRVIRALELYSEGLSYAEQKESFSHIEPFYPTIQIGLYIEPDCLAERINKRVDSMLEEGLIGEVKALLDAGYKEAITANQAIGYKEIVGALNGEYSLDEAIDRIKRATRQYAKRQRTWFRKDTRIQWVDATDQSTDELAEAALVIIAEDVYV